MAENSKIEWCDHTFNAWIGCSKVSPGCKNCYAENSMPAKFMGIKWGDKNKRHRTSKGEWRKPLKWNRQAEKLGVRYRVFTNSLADVFEDRDDLIPWRKDLFRLIDQTPHLDWLLLTKRPENIGRLLPCPLDTDGDGDCHICGKGFPKHMARKNVWLGTSIENQEQVNFRIPELLSCSTFASKLFLSCEPLIDDVDLFAAEPWNPYFRWRGETGVIGPKSEPDDFVYACKNQISWVIVGGESGPNARPMHPDWARSIRDQCKAANVPFFMKQVDKVQPIPDDLMIREFPFSAHPG